MSKCIFIKGTLSGFVLGLALAVSVGVAAAAGGDGTGGGTGNGTGGGNRDGSGGGKKKISRQIEVGQVKKQIEAAPKVQPTEAIEFQPEVPAEATEASPEVEVQAEVEAEVAPAPKKKIVIIKKAAKVKKAAKKKVIVIEQAPSEVYGYDSGTSYEQYEHGNIYSTPAVEYDGGGYGGCH